MRLDKVLAENEPYSLQNSPKTQLPKAIPSKYNCVVLLHRISQDCEFNNEPDKICNSVLDELMQNGDSDAHEDSEASYITNPFNDCLSDDSDVLDITQAPIPAPATDVTSAAEYAETAETTLSEMPITTESNPVAESAKPIETTASTTPPTTQAELSDPVESAASDNDLEIPDDGRELTPLFGRGLFGNLSPSTCVLFQSQAYPVKKGDTIIATSTEECFEQLSPETDDSKFPQSPTAEQARPPLIRTPVDTISPDDPFYLPPEIDTEYFWDLLT